MEAVVWHGKGSVSVDTVPDPKIQEPTDAIIKITATAICGSDLHLLDGYQPTMEDGDIMGYEPMGIEAGEIDPSEIITHNRPLEEAPELYAKFRDKEDGCVKVVLKP